MLSPELLRFPQAAILFFSVNRCYLKYGFMDYIGISHDAKEIFQTNHHFQRFFFKMAVIKVHF